MTSPIPSIHRIPALSPSLPSSRHVPWRTPGIPNADLTLPSPSGPVAPTLHQVRERCSSSRRIPIRPLREILRVPSGWNTCGRKVQCPRRTPSLRARALQQKASNSIMTSCRKCRDLMERLQRFRRRLQRAAGWVLSPAPTWKPYEP